MSKEAQGTSSASSETRPSPGGRDQAQENAALARSPAVHFNPLTPSSSAEQGIAGSAVTNVGDPLPQQRWPGDQPTPARSASASGCSPVPPAAPGLASPHYPQQPIYQQHLGVHPFYVQQSPQPGHPAQQHSPGQRPYPPPHPQMLHPGMMYPNYQYGQHPYWARPNGMGQQPPPTAQQYQASQQQQMAPAGLAQQEGPSISSRHTPQPAPPNFPTPQQPAQTSPSTTRSAHDESNDGAMGSDGAQRPGSKQQLHQPQLIQQQPAPPHLRHPSTIPPAMAMMPPQFSMGPPPHPQPLAAPPPLHYPAHQGPPPHFSGPPHPGMYFHPPPGAIHGHPPHLVSPGLKTAQREAVEKLVMQMANPKQQIVPELVHERRVFFERLVLLNEQQGEILSGPPQVSKSTVDLYSLYFAVKKKGGFEKTIKDKVWKHLCVEANSDMQESSAAGFQLRKHYQKYLLKLECLETGQNAKELVEFAEKQKKKKKDKDKEGGQGTAGGPATPSSSKDEQQGAGGRDAGHQQKANGTAQAHPGLPPSSYQPSQFGDYAPFGPGQYPPPPHPAQWGAYQYLPRIPLQQPMRMPLQTAEDEQRQSQPGIASTSRVSASSTPTHQADQRPISRTSSAIGDRNFESGAPQHSQEEREIVLAQTSSAFSANAPTPPLITSTAPPAAPSASTGLNPLPPSSSVGPSSYYPYGPRFPSTSDMYGPPGMYQQAQQPFTQQQRYQMAATNRYYNIQPGSSSSSASPHQSAQSKTKGHSLYKGGPAAGGVPPGMLPAGPMPYGLQGYHPYMTTWHSTVATQFQQFPLHSLEAQTITQVQQQTKRRRDKVYARDLYGATPGRIVMALRSSLRVETIWALNALNIQLYDDTTPTNPAPSLSQCPELLNLLVDHLVAALSLLFPNHFNSESLGCHRLCSAAKFATPPSFSTDHLLIANQEFPADNTRVEVLVPHLIVPAPIVISAAHHVQQHNGNNNNNKNGNNFTMVSRLGRKVKLDTEAEIPSELVRELESLAWKEKSEGEEKMEAKAKAEEDPSAQFPRRIRHSLLEHVKGLSELQRRTKLFKRPMMKANKLENGEEKFWELEEEGEGRRSNKQEKLQQKEDGQLEEKQHNSPLFFRRPYSSECWGNNRNESECPQNFSLVARPSVLQDGHADEALAELVEHCLALTNVLRGFAFLHGQDRVLAQHSGLLRLLPAVMMLMVEEKSARGQNRSSENESENGLFKMYGQMTKKEARNKDDGGEERGSEAKTMAEERPQGPGQPDQQQRPNVPAEQDSRRKWLLEVANQLRDDAFVILSQLSAQLDLFDVDSAISWLIFDALLHWCVSDDLQARDPLPSFGAIAPRHYALEILCKLSVLERNVDLLVSTGPWPRLEEFVRMLCAQICQEPPVREFAIVILNAVCAACEPACYVAAVETPLLDNLISFLEAADANMTQIVQQQGMHALRENPEIIGTSVGMLRRATLIMVQIAKHEHCQEHFSRFQHRLLQFTVSHFMDSRVAAMVANILYKIQGSAEAEVPNKDHEQETETQKEHESIVDGGENGSERGERQKMQQTMAGFPLSSDPNAFLNGTSNGGEENNNCSSVCSSSSSIFSALNMSIKQEENDCEGSRKRRVDSPQQRQNNHGKCNGHGRTISSEGSFESIDDPPQTTGKRQRMEMVAASSEEVRERMRNSILSKASLKATPQLKGRRNGWMVNSEEDGRPNTAEETLTKTKVETMMHNGAKAKEQQQPASPTTTTGAGGGSLTAVA